MDRDLPFVFIVGWIAVGLGVSVLSVGGTPHDASAGTDYDRIVVIR